MPACKPKNSVNAATSSRFSPCLCPCCTWAASCAAPGHMAHNTPATAAGIAQNARPPCQLSVPLDRRSEEHTSELQSLMRISYAVFCLKKKNHEQQAQPTKHKTT